MLFFNDAKTPRKAGGYSLDSYEPAINSSMRKKTAEDLLQMAFTESKPVPVAAPASMTIYNRMPQYNIAPVPVLKNVNYNPAQGVSIIYNNPIPRPVLVINQNQNEIYRVNNVRQLYTFPTIRSLNYNGKSNPMVYQNLIVMNNANNNAVVPTNYATGLSIVPNVQPIFTSNSANIHPHPTFGQPIMVPSTIIPNPQYKTMIYKKNLNSK